MGGLFVGGWYVAFGTALIWFLDKSIYVLTYLVEKFSVNNS